MVAGEGTTGRQPSLSWTGTFFHLLSAMPLYNTILPVSIFGERHRKEQLWRKKSLLTAGCGKLTEPHVSSWLLRAVSQGSNN